MTREKVMAGLECLTHVDFDLYETECEKRECPYRNTDCEIAVMKDAYNLLKAQEPRVMTLEEVLALKFDDVVYIQLYPTNVVISAIVIDVIPRMPNGEIGLIQFRHTQESTNNADLEYFGKTWRCWTSRPSDEQMEAVKWNV